MIAEANENDESRCAEFHGSMHELLDGELSAEQCNRLRQHLAYCQFCAQQLEAEVSFRGLLRQCCCQPAPESLRQRISYQIRIEYLK